VLEEEFIRQPWNEDDVERFLRLIEGECSLTEMARHLGRSEKDVAHQAQFLGVQLPRHEALPVATSTADSSTVSATIHYAGVTPIPRRTPV
jgi:hypothetical protein